LPFKGDIPQKAFVAGTGSMADEGMEDQGLVSTQKIYIGIFSYSDGDYTGRIYPRGYSFTAGGKIISTIYPTYILCTK
jgi:hypothetical protein